MSKSFLRFNTWLYSAVLFPVFWWVEIEIVDFHPVYPKNCRFFTEHAFAASCYIFPWVSASSFLFLFNLSFLRQHFSLYSQVIQHTLSAVAYCHSKGLSFCGVVSVCTLNQIIPQGCECDYLSYTVCLCIREDCAVAAARSSCGHAVLADSWSAVDKIRHEFTFCIEGKQVWSCFWRLGLLRQK